MKKRVSELTPDELQIRREKEREKKKKQRAQGRAESNKKQREYYANNREHLSKRKSVRYYAKQGIDESTAVVISTLKSVQRKKPRYGKFNVDQIREITRVISDYTRKSGRGN